MAEKTDEERLKIAQERAARRWREQGRTEEEIAEGIADWGKPKPPYTTRMVSASLTNPYVTMSFEELREHRMALKRELSASETQTARLKNAMDNVNKALAAISPPPLVVSDHAILRYLERYKEIDVEGIREEIRAKVQEVSFGDLGSRIVDTGEMKFVVAQSTVQTMVEEPNGRIGNRQVECNLVVTSLTPDMNGDVGPINWEPSIEN